MKSAPSDGPLNSPDDACCNVRRKWCKSEESVDSNQKQLEHHSLNLAVAHKPSWWMRDWKLPLGWSNMLSSSAAWWRWRRQILSYLTGSNIHHNLSVLLDSPRHCHLIHHTVCGCHHPHQGTGGGDNDPTRDPSRPPGWTSLLDSQVVQGRLHPLWQLRLRGPLWAEPEFVWEWEDSLFPGVEGAAMRWPGLTGCDTWAMSRQQYTTRLARSPGRAGRRADNTELLFPCRLKLTASPWGEQTVMEDSWRVNSPLRRKKK